MIRLNKLTDYAVVMLTAMSQRGDVAWTAARLSEETGVPLPTVSKLIKVLAKAEVLTAKRGAAGGCRLIRPGAEISVIEVIEAIEGPIALTDCVEGGGDCAVESLCPMRGNWTTVNNAIRGALQTVSIDDMARPWPGAFDLPAAPVRAEAPAK